MRLHTCVVATIVLLASFASVHAADPLPSWNEGAAKKSLTDFIIIDILYLNFAV